MTIKSLEGVSKERILKEFLGMLEAPFFVSKGLPLMFSTGVVSCIPGLKDIFEDMKSCFQNPAWHAEGATFLISNSDKTFEVSGSDFVEQKIPGTIERVIKCGTVFDHTMLVMEEMSKQDHDAIDMLAALLHDIGKAPAARKNGKKNPDDAWGKTIDHDLVGAPLAYDFCKNLGMTNKDCETISWLVLNHMRAHQITKMKSKYKIWKFVSHPLFPRLVKLARSDERGCRKTALDEWEGIDGALRLDRIKDLIGKPLPERILTGTDLISKGFKPGPNFSKALEKAHEFQVNLDISDKEELFKRVKGIVKGN